MRCVLQRVARASVAVEGTVVGSIDDGLLALVGVAAGDGEADAKTLAAKIATLRVFADDEGMMNKSVADTGGGVLVVSQFTLLADARKGRRPSFTAAAPPDVAEPLVDLVAGALEGLGVRTARGRFGAVMQVELVNDGPVTIILDVAEGRLR